MEAADGASFEALGLDPRLVRALGKQGLTTPTAVQARGIPLALAGKVRRRPQSSVKDFFPMHTGMEWALQVCRCSRVYGRSSRAKLHTVSTTTSCAELALLRCIRDYVRISD